MGEAVVSPACFRFSEVVTAEGVVVAGDGPAPAGGAVVGAVDCAGWGIVLFCFRGEWSADVVGSVFGEAVAGAAWGFELVGGFADAGVLG